MVNVQRSNFIRKTGLALTAKGFVQQTFSHISRSAAKIKCVIAHGKYSKVAPMHQDFRIYHLGDDDWADEDKNLCIGQWNTYKYYPTRLERV